MHDNFDNTFMEFIKFISNDKIFVYSFYSFLLSIALGIIYSHLEDIREKRYIINLKSHKVGFLKGVLYIIFLFLLPFFKFLIGLIGLILIGIVLLIPMAGIAMFLRILIPISGYEFDFNVLANTLLFICFFVSLFIPVWILLIILKTIEIIEELLKKPEQSKEDEKPTPIKIKNSQLDEWKNSLKNELNKSKSISELIGEIDTHLIKYNILLSTYEWKVKRYIILIRDKFTCQDCKKRDSGNDIHHLYYVKDEFPWEISNEGLIVLCRNCHIARHTPRETIKVKAWHFNKLVETNEIYSHCPRCEGTGYLPHYSHVQNGICFLCMANYTHDGLFVMAAKKVKEYGYDNRNLRIDFENSLNRIDEEFFKNYVFGLDFDSESSSDSDYDLPF
jgi:hypothetical protein